MTIYEFFEGFWLSAKRWSCYWYVRWKHPEIFKDDPDVVAHIANIQPPDQAQENSDSDSVSSSEIFNLEDYR